MLMMLAITPNKNKQEGLANKLFCHLHFIVPLAAPHPINSLQSYLSSPEFPFQIIFMTDLLNTIRKKKMIISLVKLHKHE
jgi:hypothetical protein